MGMGTAFPVVDANSGGSVGIAVSLILARIVPDAPSGAIGTHRFVLGS